MSERRLPWIPRLVWKNVDWKDQGLHPIARAFVLVGTSFLFEDTKVDGLWKDMTDGEKKDFPLWSESSRGDQDKVMRIAAVRQVLQKWVAKHGMSDWVVDVLLRSPGDTRKWWLLWLW